MEHVLPIACTRRGFLRFGLGVAAGAPLMLSAACGGTNQHAIQSLVNRPDAKVAIASCKTYDRSEIQDALSECFSLLGGIASLVKGKVVTIKSNLTCDGTFQDQFGKPAGESYISHGNTAIVLASMLFGNGAAKVRFVESAPFPLPLDEVLIMAGWDVTTLQALGDVELENTRNLGNGTQYLLLDVPGGGYLFSHFELNHSYSDTGVFLSLAKLKQHLTAGVTLSMKNVFGSTPNALYGSDAGNEEAIGWRGPLHGNGTADWAGINPPGANTSTPPADAGSRVPRIVADINAARPVHIAIIDGITSMSGGEGPWAPSAAPTSPGILIAGLNPVSTDAVGMAVMGYSNPLAPRGVPPFVNCDNHLLLAQQKEIGSAELSQIQVSGLTVQEAMYPYP
ncbi:MAG TPA: DUF362 domain-containing protein [Candidatus Binatia bacterium]|nr:DUF362 domain-containing protein [Candidatus Binatia bacterium]